MIDFGGPNVAKPMHVGHLRSAIIGDCLQRLFRANGWQVMSDVHLGDWGLQMGQLISEIEHRGIAPIYFDADFTGPYPEESPVTMDDLEELYPAASAACKADPARLEEARRATAELQAGRPGYRALWRHFFDVSEAGLEREFASLGVHFDLWKGEASVDALIAPMIDDLKARGLAEMSEGALVVPVARGRRQEGDAAADPGQVGRRGALRHHRSRDHHRSRARARIPISFSMSSISASIGHFEQVFRAARKAGLNGKAELEHVGFGTMNGPDGKPFKTRAGGVMKLYDLIAMATEEARSGWRSRGSARTIRRKNAPRSPKQVGIATIKFADLSNHRISDYIFDLARFSRSKARPGPICNMRRCASSRSCARPRRRLSRRPRRAIRSPEERTLVLQLLALPDAMAAAEDKRAPNILCDYAFTLAQDFSRFYSAHHILSETDADLRAARLGLCAPDLGAF